MYRFYPDGNMNDSPQMKLIREALAAYAASGDELQDDTLPDPGTGSLDAAFNRLLALTFPGRRQGSCTIDDLSRLPEDLRVELIDGYLFVMEAPSTTHQTVSGAIYAALLQHISAHNSPCFPFPATNLRPKEDNRTLMIPDIMLIRTDKVQAANRDTHVEGGPDFAVEVLSPSTRKRDLTIKLNKYQELGVRECWMIDTDRKQVMVYLANNQGSWDIRLYTFEDTIPLTICGSGFAIDFREIARILAKMPQSDAR